MTRSHAIAGSALATVIISLLAASIIVSALVPEAPSTKQWDSYGSSQGHLYQLSPIPAGADWGRS